MLVALLSFVSAASAAHVQCGDTITQDTTLDSDLTCSGGAALMAAASNVTIDLNRHTISGPGHGDGIQVAHPEYPTDVEVRNGTIRGFQTGVLTDSERTVVHHMVLEDNTVGFACSWADGCDLTDSLMRRNTVGMAAQFADSSAEDHGVIVRNSFVGNGTGLVLSNYASTVSGNYIVRNTGPGVVIPYGQDPTTNITRNVIQDNGAEGVLVSFQGNVSISNNRIARNAGSGVRMEAGGEWSGITARVHHNRISRNAADGIVIEGSDVSAGVSAEIEQNRTDRNGDDGIDVDATDDFRVVTVRANRAFFNRDLGIEAVAGTTDGGGNRAKHNGNPAQCVGVRCR